MIDTAIVGFIDILGYKEIVNKKANNVDFIKTMEALIKECVSLLAKVELENAENQYYHNKILQTLNVKVVSDSIIVTLNLNKIQVDPGCKDAVNISNYIHAFFFAIEAFCPFFIGKTGHIIRGGISIGAHYENDTDKNLFIFSKAFNIAVDLERRQANRPRIAVDKQVIEYLKNLPFYYPMDKFFYIAEDGTRCLNLYGVAALNQDSKKIYSDIKGGVTLNIEEHLQPSAPDKDILEKLRYFSTYHNSEMVKGGESFNECIIDTSLFSNI